MHNTYVVLLVIASMGIGFITSFRIGHVLITRANIGNPRNGERGVMGFVCGACAALLMAFQTYAAVVLYGLFGGLISTVAVVPAVGFCWVYLVGGNMVLAKLLEKLSKRID